jgi:hypothetical protein
LIDRQRESRLHEGWRETTYRRNFMRDFSRFGGVVPKEEQSET